MSVAEEVDFSRVRPFSVQRAILFPLLVGVGAFILMLLAANWWLDRQLSQFIISQDVIDSGKTIKSLLEKERIIFKNHLMLLTKDENLANLFEAQDRNGLLSRSQDILAALREQKITHLYFHRTNLVNFLRVHNPSMFGDLITRPMLVQANKEMDFIFGTEIGRVGTLTARGILPWFHHGKHIGFLEIGKEFSNLVQEISQQNKLEMFLFMEKNHFDKENTLDGLTMLGISADWDHYGPLFLLGSNAKEIPPGLQEYVESNFWKKKQLEQTIRILKEGEPLFFFSLPVKNFQGETVAHIVVHRHFSAIDQLTSLHHETITSLLALLTVVLGLLLYKKLGVVEHQIQESAQKLHSSENCLAKAQEIAQLGNWQIIISSLTMTCSAQIRQIAGNTMGTEGMPVDSFIERILPDDRPLFEKALHKIINKDKNQFDLELRLGGDGSTPRIVHMRGKRITDKDGELSHIVGTLQDISERRQLEESIRRNEFFLRNTVESINDGLLVINTEGQIVVANTPFVSLWQLPEEWVTWSLEEKLLPNMISNLFNSSHLVATVLNGFETASVNTLQFRDGRIFTWYTFPLKCDGAVCGCIWRFTDTTDAYLAEKREERAMQSRIAISALLETGMEPLSLHRQLEVALDIVLTVPWLSIQRKGAIFLADPQRNDLVLQAQRGLHPTLLTSCSRVAMGQCLCGLAAQTKQIIFKDQIDDDHHILYDGISPHGHYCVPILSATHLKGVLNLYILANHPANPEEEAFLTTVANVLAGIIELRETEQRLRQEQEFTATVLRTAPALVTVMNPDGEVVLFNRACQQLTGMAEQDAMGRKIWEFPVIPEEREELQRFFSHFSPDTVERHTLEHTWMCLPTDQCLIEWHMASTLNLDGTVRHVIGAGLDITHRKQTEKLLQHMAGHDPLTGLANRRLFSEHLSKAIAYAERDRKQLAVFFLDLDHFKEVNDRYGHDTGDWVLQESINRIQQEIRRSDTMARMGGDEFTLVISNVESLQDPALVANKIIDALARPFVYNGISCRIGVSIGISLFPQHGRDGETLLSRSDQAMYKAKQQGRNRFIFFSTLDD